MDNSIGNSNHNADKYEGVNSLLMMLQDVLRSLLGIYNKTFVLHICEYLAMICSYPENVHELSINLIIDLFGRRHQLLSRFIGKT